MDHRRHSTQARAALWFLLLAPLALACPSLLSAQAAGSIHGTVLDPSGFAVSNAAVKATPATGAPVNATTSATGAYNMNNLPAGTYTIDVTVAGFAPYKKESVVVTGLPRGSVLDINLTIQQQKDQVTVKRRSPHARHQRRQQCQSGRDHPTRNGCAPRRSRRIAGGPRVFGGTRRGA